MENAAYKIKDIYLVIELCDEGWDYSLYDKDFELIDGGQIDEPDFNLKTAKNLIVHNNNLDADCIVKVDYDDISSMIY